MGEQASLHVGDKEGWGRGPYNRQQGGQGRPPCRGDSQTQAGERTSCAVIGRTSFKVKGVQSRCKGPDTREQVPSEGAEARGVTGRSAQVVRTLASP